MGGVRSEGGGDRGMGGGTGGEGRGVGRKGGVGRREGLRYEGGKNLPARAKIWENCTLAGPLVNCRRTDFY